MIFLALTAFAAVSMGQYASSTVSTVVPIIGISLTPAATAENPKPTSSGAIQAGDTIELPNGLKLVVDPHTRVLPGTRLKVSRDGKDMGEVTVPALKPAVDFGLFAAAFSIAGPIPQSNGSFLGGTKTVWGQIVSADYHLKPKKPTQALGIGGWYFHPDKPQYNNLYQVHARFFAKPGFGVQAAYINSTQFSDLDHRACPDRPGFQHL